MQELSGRGVVVIGGGSGVGRTIALALQAEGTHALIGEIDGDSAKATAEMMIIVDGHAPRDRHLRAAAQVTSGLAVVSRRWCGHHRRPGCCR